MVVQASELLARDDSGCALCDDVFAAGDKVLVCPDATCSAHFHTACLGRNLLGQEGPQSSSLVPSSGHCPVCASPLLWARLMRDGPVLAADGGSGAAPRGGGGRGCDVPCTTTDAFDDVEIDLTDTAQLPVPAPPPRLPRRADIGFEEEEEDEDDDLAAFIDLTL